MIRRGFWLLAGATLGVSGYRRATRLAHSFVPVTRRPGPAGTAVLVPRAPLTGRRVLSAAARAGRSTAQGGAFARDVRDGMAEYLDRHAGGAGRTLEDQQGHQLPGRAAPGDQRRRPAP